MPAGRPTFWTPERRAEAMERICAAIEAGEALDVLCKADPTLPGHGTVREWLAEDAEFAASYARAREAQAHLYARQIVEIADAPVLDWEVVGEDEQGPAGDNARRVRQAAERAELERRRQQIDARKWTASKLAPKVYGDRLQLDGDMNVKLTDDQLESRLAQLLGKAGAGAVARGERQAEGEEEVQ